MKAERQMRQWIIILLCLGCTQGIARASLPTTLQPLRDLDIALPSALSGIEIGPDGKLWIFSRETCLWVDPVNRYFGDDDDVVSPQYNLPSNGAVFDPNGRLLTLDNRGNGVLRDSVDGVFFNGNDSLQTISFSWDIFGMGNRESFGVAFDGDGRLYLAGNYWPEPDVYVGRRLARLDPVDGILGNGDDILAVRGNHEAAYGMFGTYGITFDSLGNLYLASIYDGIAGVDPVDNEFLNGDDISQKYVGVHPAHQLVNVAFDHADRVFVVDAGVIMTNAPPVPEPATMSLLAVGAAAMVGRRRGK